MNDERMDIRITPRWRKIVFSDGYDAWLVGSTPKKDGEGREVCELTLCLYGCNTLIKRHNIGFGELFDKVRLLIKMSYPAESIIPLNDDPGYPVSFCILNFRGNKTPSSELFESTKYIEKIQKLKKELITKDAEIASIKEELRKSKINVEAYIKERIETFAPMIKQTLGIALAQPSSEEIGGMGGTGK